MSSHAEASCAEEVFADQSREESWTFLNGDEIEDEPLPEAAALSCSSTDRSSDIEVIEHDSDEETLLNESVSRFRVDGSDSQDGSFIEDDGSLDLSPGQKAYIHVPNNSVNFWLNLSLLVAVASVVGLGLGNYIGSYVNWTRHAAQDEPHQPSHLRQLQQQLIDCLHAKEILMNTSAFKDIKTTDYFGSFDQTATSFVGPRETALLQKDQDVRRPDASSDTAITLQSHETHPRHSEVQAHRKRQIVRKSSATMSILPEESDRYQENSSPHLPHHSIVADAGSVVIETSTSIMFRAKTRAHSKKRDGFALESEIRIWLLLTDKGTSRPIFLSDEERTDRKKVVAQTFKPFLTKNFAPGSYIVWLEGENSTRQTQEWSGVNVRFSDQNPYSLQSRKTAKYFWSNLKKKVFKNWRGGDASEFESRVIDVLLSLPESQFDSMFEKMRSKIRRSGEAMRSRRLKTQVR